MFDDWWIISQMLYLSSDTRIHNIVGYVADISRPGQLDFYNLRIRAFPVTGRILFERIIPSLSELFNIYEIWLHEVTNCNLTVSRVVWNVIDIVSETKVNFMLKFFVYNLANSLNKNKAGFRPLYLIPVITVEKKFKKMVFKFLN